MNNGKITKDNNKVTKTKTTNNNSKKPSSKHLMTGTAIFIAAILIISGTNIKAAFADTVLNNVVSTASGKIVSVTAGGTTSAVGYGLRVVGSDGQGGCNAEDGSTAKLTFSGVTGLTQSPNPLEINDCTGSSFPFGVTFNVPANTPAADYTIVVSVTDSGSSGTVGTYDTSQAGFILRVAQSTPLDITAPVVTVPGPKTVEATGPSGASVAFTATATDNIDGQLTPKCYIGQTEIASPNTFPLGTTTVECKATDEAGNTGSNSFTVEVQDTTAPTLTLPPLDSPPVEGNTLGGATVTYTASATDIVDGPLTINCNPISGSTFALGTTTVNCDATDAHQNKASGEFSVTVVDTTAPTVNLDQAPPTVTSATGPNGATVQFTVSAQDTVSGPITPTCDAQSGDTFKVGDTVVKCSATDGVGLTGTLDIPISVQYDRTLFSFPLAPLNKDGSSVYKLNSNIPVQFKGTYADNGGPITTGTFTIKVYKVDNSADGPVNEAVATDAATTGYNFRYTTDGIWKYNLATKTLGAGDYYVLVDFNDGGADASKTITTTSGSPGQVKVGVKK